MKKKKDKEFKINFTLDKEIQKAKENGDFFGNYDTPPFATFLCLKCGRLINTSYFNLLANEDFCCPECGNTDLAHAKLDGMMRVDNDKIEIKKSKLSGFIEEAEDTVIQNGIMSLSNSFEDDDLVNHLFAMLFDKEENKIKYWGNYERPHTFGGGKCYLPIGAEYCYMGPIGEEIFNPNKYNPDYIVFWLDYPFEKMEQGTNTIIPVN